jgi:hypothetical protein
MHIFVCKLRLHFPDSEHPLGFACHEIFGIFFRYLDIFGLHPPTHSSYGADSRVDKDLTFTHQTTISKTIHSFIATSDPPEAAKNLMFITPRTPVMYVFPKIHKT